MSNLSERFALYCVQQGVIQKEQLSWFIYGIEKRLSSFVVSIPFFVISLHYTSLECTFSFFTAFYFLRRRTNGYHAQSACACLCTSLLLEILLLSIVNSLFNGYFFLFCVTISTVLIYKLAPFNHPNMNYTKDEIAACRSSAHLYTYILTFLAFVAYVTELYEFAKGLTLGITMTAVLLCMAYIIEWRK